MLNDCNSTGRRRPSGPGHGGGPNKTVHTHTHTHTHTSFLRLPPKGMSEGCFSKDKKMILRGKTYVPKSAVDKETLARGCRLWHDTVSGISAAPGCGFHPHPAPWVKGSGIATAAAWVAPAARIRSRAWELHVLQDSQKEKKKNKQTLDLNNKFSVQNNENNDSDSFVV